MRLPPAFQPATGGTAFKFGVLDGTGHGGCPDQRWTKDRGLSRCLPLFAAVTKDMIINGFCKCRCLPAFTRRALSRRKQGFESCRFRILRLVHLTRERPAGRRAAEQRDELAVSCAPLNPRVAAYHNAALCITANSGGQCLRWGQQRRKRSGRVVGLCPQHPQKLTKFKPWRRRAIGAVDLRRPENAQEVCRGAG